MISNVDVDAENANDFCYGEKLLCANQLAMDSVFQRNEPRRVDRQTDRRLEQYLGALVLGDLEQVIQEDAQGTVTKR